MTTWLLVFYFWNVLGAGRDAVGGPALSITEVSSQQTCEAIGAAAKKFIDEKAKNNFQERWAHSSEPADYRCISIKTAQRETDIQGRQRIIKENQQYLESLRQQLK